jgi:hypothetical protein
MAEKKINFGIDDGNSFFAHEVSVNFNPTQFIFDFKCITPRVDPRSNEGPFININHNVVMLDIYHAKRFLEFLDKRIKDYEKEFGKITKPKPIKIVEKKRDKKSKEKKEKVATPSYFG